MAGAVNARPRLSRRTIIGSLGDPHGIPLCWLHIRSRCADTRLCVLGWDIDTVAMTISVPLEKLERLCDTLHELSPDRVVASEEELRSLIDRLLHLCEVVRPGKYFVRRMINQVGLPPARAWSAKYHASHTRACLLYTSPSPRDKRQSRMPSSA